VSLCLSVCVSAWVGVLGTVWLCGLCACVYVCMCTFDVFVRVCVLRGGVGCVCVCVRVCVRVSACL